MTDWTKAREHLTACEQVYTVFESAGYLVFSCVISPLQDRLNNGERTKKLWKEIMETPV